MIALFIMFTLDVVVKLGQAAGLLNVPEKTTFGIAFSAVVNAGIAAWIATAIF